jgi:nicotinamide-nucleotide amidase
MNAEIIAVGSEMLGIGRVDTNSLYLTGELANLGVEVVYKCVVGDDRARLTAQVAQSMGRSEIVILSGGLGPTEDDLTREAVAAAVGREMYYDEAVARWLVSRFAAAKRTMAEVNKRQCWVIQGAEILSNDRGTAPGQWVEHNGSRAILLPGPPHELKAMFERECLPRLKKIVPPLAIRTVFMRVAGMGESDLDQLIAPVYKKYENPVTTILAAAGDIQIHLRARCASVEEADRLLAEVREPIRELLGDRIYSFNGDPLEVVVGNLLKERGATVAVAESATGGMLGAKLTSVPGSSSYFLGGFLTYSDEMKHKLLGVPAELLAEHGAASRPVAEAMATGARKRTGATYGVSVTGVAGPDAGTEKAPRGLMHIAVADSEGVLPFQRQFLGDRERIRGWAAQTALDSLRRAIDRKRI